MRFLRSFLNSLNSIKLIEPRARRASPQGHGKSLPDAVKNIDFASLLEGFWPKPSGNQRARPRQSLVHEFYFFVVFAILSFDLSSEASKVRYCRSLVFSHFQDCDTVVLESGRVLTIFHNCDTVVLDSHQDFPIFSIFPELRYCSAGMIPDFLLLVSSGPWAAWRAWAPWAASAAWVAWAA